MRLRTPSTETAWCDTPSCLVTSSDTLSLDRPDPLVAAWALKDACYAAWSSDPQRAVSSAAELRSLHGRLSGVSPAVKAEVQALVQWTEGISQMTQGRMDAACGRFEAAAAVFRDLGQAARAAETQVPRIVALSILGRHEQAAACAEQTQRAFVALGDARAAGKVSLNLGSLQLRREAYDDAARHYREAAVLFARVGDREHSVMADIGLADALTARGEFAEASRMYARARMRAQTHGLPVLEAIVDESMALLELVQGRYREALEGFERSRRRYEALAMPQHLAIAEKQLADAYLELRLLPEALALLDGAVLRFAELDMPDDQAWALAQRGRALALLGRGAAATDALLGASALFAEQGSQVGEAAVALVRAELALAGADHGQAQTLARHAASAFEAAGQLEGRLRAESLLAQALWLSGRIDEAGRGFDTLLAAARQQQLLAVQVRALTGRGLVAQARGAIGPAREAFTEAIELFEVQRDALPGDDMRNAFLADHLRPYQELLKLALADASGHPGGSGAAEVLRQLERFRARALADRLQQGQTRSGPLFEAGAPASPRDRPVEDLRSRLSWLYRRQDRLRQEGEDAQAVDRLVQQAEHELLERQRRQRLASSANQAPAGAQGADAVRRGPELSLDVAGLCGALDQGDAMVAYGVVDDELFACVVTRTGVRLQRAMARWSDTLEALRSMRFQIETLRFGHAPVQAHQALLERRARQRLERLHALIWAPLQPHLGGVRRVLVVPHGPLGQVPFAALPGDQGSLAERCMIAVAPSVRVAWHGLMRQPRSPRRVVAFGESSQLPHAAREARRVAGLFADGVCRTDHEATLAEFERLGPGADVVHLACHARFRADNPLFSALSLADGLLTAEAAERMRLAAGTVVLSGCDTGAAGQDAGDDRVGLVRAFLVAGASRVVASLWPVDDAVAAEFMQAFYAALVAGQTPAAALQAAQIELMPRHPHPFYWAAFTLHGGW